MARDRDEDRPVTIRGCKAVNESAKALLVRCGDWEADKWIPKSVITDDSEVFARDGDGDLVIAGWFARKEGLA